MDMRVRCIKVDNKDKDIRINEIYDCYAWINGKVLILNDSRMFEFYSQDKFEKAGVEK